MITTKEILISEIVTDAGTQVRAAINEEVVASYAEAMADGATFPHPVVYHDGTSYFLADGFHRLFAAKRNGVERMRFEVHKGTRADALKYGLSANFAHGLRRSNEDKRNSIKMALAEWPNLSSREIAKICAVSDMLVGTIRNQLQESCSSTRIGADGKHRRVSSDDTPAVQAKEVTGEAAVGESAAASASQNQDGVVVSECRVGGRTQSVAGSARDAGHAVPALDTTPPDKSADFLTAVGLPSAKNFFASEVEDLAASIIADASEEQLSAAILQWQVELRKLKHAQHQRNQERKAA